MKRFLLVSLTALALLSLTACGGSNSEQPVYKTVENQTITISGKELDNSGEVQSYTAEGQYTGEVLDDVPNGDGIFVWQNDKGVSITYTGEFKDGQFHGKGETTWDGSDFKNVGTYTEGLFTPNTFEMFDSISAVVTAPFSISKENQAFIESHLELFPAETNEDKEELSALIQTDLTYAMMNKTLKGLDGKFYHCPAAYAVQVFEQYAFDHSITQILCQDDNYNNYYVLYDGVLPEVYDGVSIEFVGLPVSLSGFDNVGGGVTNVIVMLGSSITVI